MSFTTKNVYKTNLNIINIINNGEKPLFPDLFSQNRKSSFTKQSDYNNFSIDSNKVLYGLDQRTTVMIKNIPNKYTLKLLTDEINMQFSNKYDFIYLPLDFSVDF